MSQYPYAQDLIDYFINGVTDNDLADVFSERYERTGVGEDLYMQLSEYMMDYEYSFPEYMETIDEHVKALVGDDPNYGSKTAKAGQRTPHPEYGMPPESADIGKRIEYSGFYSNPIGNYQDAWDVLVDEPGAGVVSDWAPADPSVGIFNSGWWVMSDEGEDIFVENDQAIKIGRVAQFDVPLYFAATDADGVWGVYLSYPEERLVRGGLSTRDEAIALADAMNADADSTSSEEQGAASSILDKLQNGTMYQETPWVVGKTAEVDRLIVGETYDVEMSNGDTFRGVFKGQTELDGLWLIVSGSVYGRTSGAIWLAGEDTVEVREAAGGRVAQHQAPSVGDRVRWADIYGNLLEGVVESVKKQHGDAYLDIKTSDGQVVKNVPFGSFNAGRPNMEVLRFASQFDPPPVRCPFCGFESWTDDPSPAIRWVEGDIFYCEECDQGFNNKTRAWVRVDQRWFDKSYENGVYKDAQADYEEDGSYLGDAPYECPLCGGEGEGMGSLGAMEWYRCRQCGADFSVGVVEEQKSSQFAPTQERYIITVDGEDFAVVVEKNTDEEDWGIEPYLAYIPAEWDSINPVGYGYTPQEAVEDLNMEFDGIIKKVGQADRRVVVNQPEYLGQSGSGRVLHDGDQVGVEVQGHFFIEFDNNNVAEWVQKQYVTEERSAQAENNYHLDEQSAMDYRGAVGDVVRVKPYGSGYVPATILEMRPDGKAIVEYAETDQPGSARVIIIVDPADRWVETTRTAQVINGIDIPRMIQEARSAGATAATQRNQELISGGPVWEVFDADLAGNRTPGGNSYTMHDVCGFAWIHVPNGRDKVVQAMKKVVGEGNQSMRASVSKAYGKTGYDIHIYDMENHLGPNAQYMSVQAAAYRAALQVLQRYGLGDARVETRMD